MERPIEQVAAEYVQLLNEPCPTQARRRQDRAHDIWMLHQMMCRRCGPDHAKTHIDRAQETYDLMSGKPPRKIRGKEITLSIIDDFLMDQ